MILYYIGNHFKAKLKVSKDAELAKVDALMARDGLKRCTRKEWADFKAE